MHKIPVELFKIKINNLIYSEWSEEREADNPHPGEFTEWKLFIYNYIIF